MPVSFFVLKRMNDKFSKVLKSARPSSHPNHLLRKMSVPDGFE